MRKRTYRTNAVFEYALNFWIHEGELLLLLLKDESAYIVHQAIKKNFQQNIEVRLVPIVNTNSLTNKEKYLLIIFMSNAILVYYKIGLKEADQNHQKNSRLL